MSTTPHQIPDKTTNEAITAVKFLKLVALDDRTRTMLVDNNMSYKPTIRGYNKMGAPPIVQGLPQGYQPQGGHQPYPPQQPPYRVQRARWCLSIPRLSLLVSNVNL